MREVPFVGGNLSRARRVGDVVQRDAGAWTPTVHALLRHLHARGFRAAPTPISYDEDAETLAFVAGETHVGWPEPLPEWVYDPRTAASAARLLRAFHDTTALFTPPEAKWRIVAPTPHEVICHNDWAPYNAVFTAHEVTAMLDWDTTGPGSRLWDLTRAAFVWVPLYTDYDAIDTREKGTRLRLFCAAYGWNDPAAVIDLLPSQLRWYADNTEREARGGHPGFVKLVSWGVPEGHRRDAEILAREAPEMKAGAT